MKHICSWNGHLTSWPHRLLKSGCGGNPQDSSQTKFPKGLSRPGKTYQRLAIRLCFSGFHSSTESLKRDSCTCQQESHSPAKAAQHPRVCSVWRDQAERKCFNSTHRCSLLKCFKSQITWGERHPYIWKTQIKTSNIIGKTHKNYNHIHHFTQ